MERKMGPSFGLCNDKSHLTKWPAGRAPAGHENLMYECLNFYFPESGFRYRCMAGQHVSTGLAGYWISIVWKCVFRGVVMHTT